MAYQTLVPLVLLQVFGTQTSAPLCAQFRTAPASVMSQSLMRVTGALTTPGTGLGFETSAPDLFSGGDQRDWLQHCDTMESIFGFNTDENFNTGREFLFMPLMHLASALNCQLIGLHDDDDASRGYISLGMMLMNDQILQCDEFSNAAWYEFRVKGKLHDLTEIGHHETEEGKMAVTYAKDALAAAIVKLGWVVEAISKALFDPGLHRAERVAQATGATLDPRAIAEKPQVELETDIRLTAEELSCAAEMAGSDVDDAEVVEEAPIALPGERLAHEHLPFPEIAPSCCVKHRLSGIVHMIAEVDKLACGRHMTCNMLPFG